MKQITPHFTLEEFIKSDTALRVGSNLTFIVLPAERNRMGTLFWLVALCARKILR